MSLNPLTMISSWFERFRWRRLPARSLPYRVARQKKYIFFPILGFVHFLMLAILVAFCINYSNNLGIVCICLLAVIYLTSIFKNYFALKKLEVLSIQHVAHQDTERGALLFSFRYVSKRPLRSYPLMWMKIQGEDFPIEFDSSGHAQVKWTYNHLAAGVYQVPCFIVYTLWPNSITRSWADVKADTVLAVVPSSSVAHERASQSSSQVSSSKMVQEKDGDVDGVRDVLPHEHPSKISWKHTARHNKLMTYTWEKPQKNSVVIHWPEGPQSPLQKSYMVRDEMQKAIDANKYFQLRHPQFSSHFGQGEAFGVSMLALVMLKTVPAASWKGEKA